MITTMATSQIAFTKILNMMEKHNVIFKKNSKFLYKKTFHKITKFHLRKIIEHTLWQTSFQDLPIPITMFD